MARAVEKEGTCEHICLAWLDGATRGEPSARPGLPDVGVAGGERGPGLLQAKGACVWPGGS